MVLLVLLSSRAAQKRVCTTYGHVCPPCLMPQCGVAVAIAFWLRVCAAVPTANRAKPDYCGKKGGPLGVAACGRAGVPVKAAR